MIRTVAEPTPLCKQTSDSVLSASPYSTAQRVAGRCDESRQHHEWRKATRTREQSSHVYEKLTGASPAGRKEDAGSVAAGVVRGSGTALGSEASQLKAAVPVCGEGMSPSDF